MDGGLSVAPGTGEGAMKKLFAYAAIALFGTGALILSTHTYAKPGGFKGHWAFAGPHFHGAHPHHFAFAPGFAHHHHFVRDFGFGFDFPYAGYDAPYAEPLIVEVPRENDDITGSTELRRVSLWRGNAPHSGGCSVENVTVPASQGGDTSVRVIRC
jgi:hypothetical protein